VIRSLALCFLLLSCVAGAQPPLASDERNYRFEFVSARIGEFDIRGHVGVAWRDAQPYVQSVECFGDNQDVRFSIDMLGRLDAVWLAFRGLPDEDGDRERIALTGDRLWLYIDGKRYEYANIEKSEGQFSNYKYPEYKPDYREIILVWRGHQSVRASDTDHFMHMSRIHSDIIRAKKLEWGFKSRNWEHVDHNEPENRLPDGWETRRYPINNGQLGQAIDWCTRQVASDAARMFPVHLLEEKQN
jgi:hypothetical protein